MSKIIESKEIAVVMKILEAVNKNLVYKEESDSYTGEFFVNLSLTDREHLQNVLSKLN